MQLRTRLAASFLLVAGLAVALLPEAAESQYFGRNKVQYQDFDFSVLETEHFEIYYYEQEEEAAVQAGRMAERWYARLSRVLDHELRGKQPIVLYGSHPAFEQTNAVLGQIGETTGGVTEALKRRIVLPLGMSMKESDHVLGHELVHAFQFDLTGQGPDAVGLDVPVALRMPLWFIEGMAEYLSIGSEDAFTAEWLRGALMADELPEWGDLGKSRYFPYRYGHALWSYVGGRFGDQAVGNLLKGAAQTGSMRQAFTRVLGIHTDTLISDWHEAIREVQGPVLEVTEEAGLYGRPLASEGTTDTRQNLAPSLSPDGELMVFASEKNLFSIELFVLDVETGEVLRKLTETARDPHFESLQWVGSSGEWSPDGRLYALAGINKGRPVISLFDPRSGDRVREIKLRQFGEIFNPTWSPDGDRIAFSAQTGGFTDLHVLDLGSGEVRTLTRDPYADIHPAWSPDGERIAFVTDRFGSNLDLLVPGQYRLATIDPETGAIEELAAFEEGKHINPRWGPGGEELYFLSDRSGITNLYRLETASGEFRQITNLKTGISGISGLSPSLSVARDTELAVFSVHGEGNFVFEIYAVDDARVLAGTPVDERSELAGLTPRKLPPVDRDTEMVDRLLANEELGLASAVTFEKRDYDPTLSLDFLGRPNLAVGSDQFGFFVGGGGSAFFSDMLGNRNLSTLVQVDGSTGDVFKSTAFFTSYTNRSNRVNWGVVGGQLPRISRSFNLVSVNDPVAGPLFIFQDFRFWEINRELTGVIEYPFNRAQRIEVSGGFRSVAFASEIQETVISRVNGQVLARDEFDFTPLDTLSTMNQARASAALVYDNAIFGATAPMVGQRYRLEVSPTTGSVDYYTLLADYRKYVMPFQPFTIAGRIMHLGRYGADAEDRRLQDYFIGFPSLVRGYEAGSFDFEECPPTDRTVDDVDDITRGTGFCPAFDQLLGSRVGVMNAELRLPFLGGIGIIPAANVPPIDLIGFFDAGIAWTRDIDPTFIDDGPRQFVRSVGVGARINLFGLAVFEVDYVNPLDRELQDWFWDFSVTPGF